MKRKLIAALLCLAMVLSLAGCQSAPRDSQESGSAVVLSSAVETVTESGTQKESGKKQKDKAEETGNRNSEDGEDLVKPEISTPAPKSNPNSKTSQKLNKVFQEQSEDAQDWLYDYLFGAVVEDDFMEEDSDVGETSFVQLDEAELAAAMQEFLKQTDFLTSNECKTTSIQDYVNLSNRSSEEIYGELEAKGLLSMGGKVMEIYDSMSPELQAQVQQYLTSKEESGKQESGNQLNLAGRGHAWMIDVIQKDEAGVRLWKELSPDTQKKLIGSMDAGAQSEGNEASMSDTKDDQERNSGSPLLIVFIVVSAVLLIALIIVLAMFLRRTKEMQERISKERSAKRKLELELEQSRETKPKPEQRAVPSGTMSPSMRVQFQNSPTRVGTPQRAQQYQPQTYRKPAPAVRQPVEEPRPVRVGIGAAAAAAASQRDGNSTPVASFSAAQPAAVDNRNVIDGYYSVTAKCREDARYNLDVSLVIEKRSTQPVDPPLPYIVYGDRSVTLNMDYYNRVGGSRPSNERAWDAMMNAATQIDRCFNIRSASTGPVITPAEAAGRRIVEVRRARINEDGTVAAKGEIVLE